MIHSYVYYYYLLLSSCRNFFSVILLFTATGIWSTALKRHTTDDIFKYNFSCCAMLLQENQHDTPQNVEVRLCCLRATRDKLPRGLYTVSVSLQSRLGGPAVARHSETTQHQWSVSTEPIEHLGRYYSTDLNINQSVRMVRAFWKTLLVMLSGRVKIQVSIYLYIWLKRVMNHHMKICHTQPPRFFLQGSQYE